MDVVVLVLISGNVVIGLLLGLFAAKRFSALVRGNFKVSFFFRILIAVYFIECIAVTISMGTPLLSVILAFIWGIAWGLWFRKHAPEELLSRLAFGITLYSCVPVCSLLLIPVAASIGGWPVLSSEAGYRFGVPDFLHLPGPLSTILGFYLLLVIGSLLFKIVITAGEIYLVYHLKREDKTS